MDKSSKLALLQNLSDEALDQAMAAIGINAGSEDFDRRLGEGGEEKIQFFADMPVDVPRTIRQPFASTEALSAPIGGPIQKDPLAGMLLPDESGEAAALIAGVI